MNTQENSESNASPQAAGAQKRKRWRLLLILATVVALIGGSAYGYYALYGRYHASTDDAYVQGNLNSISPQIDGTVVQVFAEDGDLVREGQTLVTLDASNTAIALENAEANLANVVRQTRGLYSDVDNYQAQVKVKEVNYEQAQADYKRRQGLAKRGAISVEELHHYRDALDAARNSLNATRQSLNEKLALTDGVQIAHHPAIKAAIAQLQRAFLDNLHTTIKAPVTGYVSQRSVQVGEQVNSSSTLMVVVPLHQVWVDANFKENQLRQMHIGQSVDVTTDLYGSGVHYKGRIESLGIGTGSAFALLPAQNATGNWIKIVQRLPVRIALEGDNLDTHPLRIGLSAYVDVRLHDQQGPLLSQQSPVKARFTTSIYQDQLKQSRALVTRILTTNGIDASEALQDVAEVPQS